MLPLPLDWSAEIEPPAKFYQHCLPKVFRHVNSVTDTSDEIAGFLHGEHPATTDQWETAHFQSMTGEWEDELGIYKACGFSSVFDAERILTFKEGEDKEFPSVFGYFDEGRLFFCVHRLMVRQYPVFLAVCGSYSFAYSQKSNVFIVDGFDDTCSPDYAHGVDGKELSSICRETW